MKIIILKAIFYEVKNTFNEQHTYIFKIKNNEKIEQKCKKKFYVSPLWIWKLTIILNY